MGNNSSTHDSEETVSDQPRAATDGTGDTAARQSHLHAVFVNVTGVEECVAEQEETQMSRYVNDNTNSVSRAASAVATDDGLTDTIDAPQSNDEMA